MDEQEFETEHTIAAYHEAGHAVMALACGYQVDEIRILDPATGYAHMAYQAPSSTTIELARKEALVSAAGLAADDLLSKIGRRRRSQPLAGHSDRKRVTDLIKQFPELGSYNSIFVYASLFLYHQWFAVKMIAELVLQFSHVPLSQLDLSKFPKLPESWQEQLMHVLDDDV